MKQKIKRTLTPKLRFPEFRDKGEWGEKKLGDVSEVLMCKRIFASETSPNGEVPFYKIGTLGGVPDAFIPKDLFEEYKSKYNFPRIGEVLITCSGTIGKCLPYDGSEAYFQDSNIVWIDNSMLEVSNEFLLSILSNVNWGTLNSTTITRIYGPDLRGLPIKFPQNEKEQQRITDCLSALDTQIAAEGRALEALKTHKNGLMQQLFPQPGQTQPRLRFPEFRDKREWDVQPLGDICERIMDGTHFSPKTKEGPRPYLTSKNIRNGAMDLSSVTFISEEEHRAIYKRCPVRIHDVLLTKDGANTGNCTINTLDYEFSLLSSVAVLRGNSELLDQQFLYQNIASDRTQQLILGSMSGQAIARITLTKLGEYPIAYPSKEEQQRIADCLSSLDTQITAQAAKIEALKTHKRGLMQQLFPAPEEQ